MKTPEASLASVLATFTQLERDLTAAGQGPLDPQLRAELGRIAAASHKSAVELGAAQQTATQQLAAKKQRTAVLTAANKQAIAQKKKQLAAKKRKADSEAPIERIEIDPTLGRRRGEELLKRQQINLAMTDQGAGPAGVLDSWGAEAINR